MYRGAMRGLESNTQIYTQAGLLYIWTHRYSHENHDLDSDVFFEAEMWVNFTPWRFTCCRHADDLFWIQVTYIS